MNPTLVSEGSVCGTFNWVRRGASSGRCIIDTMYFPSEIATALAAGLASMVIAVATQVFAKRRHDDTAQFEARAKEIAVLMVVTMEDAAAVMAMPPTKSRCRL